VNIPLDRLLDEVGRTFSKGTDLVVYGSDDASTEAAQGVLQALGFRHVLTIPGGFDWFRNRRISRIDHGPN
jgi:rhodanese-related sulfurtransferase